MAETIALQVSGMHCASCVGRAEKAIAAQPGVRSAVVNLVSGTAYVTVDGTPIDTLTQALGDIGYGATLRSEDGSALSHRQEAQDTWRRFCISLALVLPVFLVEMGGHLIPAIHHWVNMNIGQSISWAAQAVLVTLALAWPGRPFFQLGARSLLRRAPDMNALVALGAGAAWLYSMIVMIVPGAFPEPARVVYFEAAGVIVTLILLGRFLEARAKGQAGAAISALMELRPDTAHRVQGETIREVALADVRRDDLLIVRPGERFAADGVVVEGEGHVDEAMLTGEAEPVSKSEGDPVSAGTINGTGSLVYMVSAIGANTRLSQIMELVDAAQGQKSPIRAQVDRVTAVFVPIVMFLAAITFAGWILFGGTLAQAVVAAVSVLIIACPCAMGLAVPVSIVVATGRAAQIGVLFRGGAAVEKLAQVQQMAFDKTGTLTEGKPRMTTFLSKESDALLGHVAALEAQSEHPLAQAIVDAVPTPRGKVSGFQAMPGLGVRGMVDKDLYAVGNARFMDQMAVDLAPLTDYEMQVLEEGATPVFVARNGAAVAVLGIQDPIKSDAKSALEDLTASGVKLALLSGDRREVAESLARTVSLDTVKAELMPEDKLVQVRKMQTQGPIAFVGDGINDAPALAQADVGIAMGNGTDVAMETADVVLMSGRVGALPSAVRLSKATMANIRQNLFWAFGYNVALIPVAMGVFYPLFGWQLSPMLGAAAMALSSVFVVTNALRLRKAV